MNYILLIESLYIEYVIYYIDMKKKTCVNVLVMNWNNYLFY